MLFYAVYSKMFTFYSSSTTLTLYQLLRVNSVKYLEIQISTDMSWSTHIANICSKTRKHIGLMYCQFHLCKPETVLKFYKTFIRPHMEYPQLCGIHITVKISKCQKKVCFENMLQGLVLPVHQLPSLTSLASRCKQAKLCHLYKIFHGLTDCQCVHVVCKRTLSLSVTTQDRSLT